MTFHEDRDQRSASVRARLECIALQLTADRFAPPNPHPRVALHRVDRNC
jgi:hypothetical protein